MRHYRAELRRDSTRWDYCVEINGVMYPVGYCIGKPNFESQLMIDALGGRDSAAYRYYADFAARNINHFHAHGHDSKEDACRCYRRYLLDSRLTLNVKTKYTGSCMECGAQTELVAKVDQTAYRLCLAHNVRASVEKHMPVVFERWES